MDIDIYLTGKNSNGVEQKVQIPVIPETIPNDLEGRFSEYDILKVGEVHVPNGKNLEEYGWESFFPGEARKGSRIIRKWTDPATLNSLMKYWLRAGTELNLIVTGTKINKDVYISEYHPEFKLLGDYYYSIKFIEARHIEVSSTKRKSKTTKKKVKVKKGQTLRKLAKKYLGSSKKYKLIYNANKKLIDARNKKERKKHPKKKISKYTIYKGQTLVIPGVSSSKSVANSRVLELKKAMNKDGYCKLKLDNKLTSAMKTAMKKIALRSGKKGQVVRFVQKYVKAKVDGTYGSSTRTKVKAYQRKHKLTINGVADYKTLLKMIS